MEEAVTVDEMGPKIRPELMEPERIYHCMYKDHILLFFIDDQKFLSCYEIEDQDIVERIQKYDGPIEKILKECATNHDADST